MTNETQVELGPERARIGHWLLLAAIALGIFFYTLLKPPGRRENPTAIGEQLEQLRLEPLTGGGRAIGLGDLAGRVTVINFWGTWCPPCVMEFPHVVALDRRYRKRKTFQLFAVSCESQGDTQPAELAADTDEFLRAQNFELAAYADPDAVTRRAVEQVLGETNFGYPTTLVLDASGVIQGVWVGYEPGLEREVEALVKKLLAESET